LRTLVKAYCERLTNGARCRDFGPLLELLDDEIEFVLDSGARRRGKHDVLELLSLLPDDYGVEAEIIGSDGVQVIMDFRSRSASFHSIHRGVQRLKVRNRRIAQISYRV